MALIRELPSGRYQAVVIVNSKRETKTFDSRFEADLWGHGRDPQPYSELPQAVQDLYLSPSARAATRRATERPSRHPESTAPCEINPETNVPIPTIETVIVMPDGTTVPFDERLF